LEEASRTIPDPPGRVAVEEAAATRILIKDSATGKSLQSPGLTEADYRGGRFAEDTTGSVLGRKRLVPLARK
jgi:methionine synthase I (cobalamin-dependent)